MPQIEKHSWISRLHSQLATRFTIEASASSYTRQPGDGHHRAAARIKRQRAVWANTPVNAKPESRQVRRRRERTA